MLFYIYLFTSLIGSGFWVWQTGVTNPFAIIGLFPLFFVLLYILCFMVHLLVFAIGGFTINTEKLPKTIHTFYRWYGFESLIVFMKSLRISIHIHGMEKMPEKGTPFLLIGNHRSIIDPMIGLVYFKPWDLAYVSKQENLKIPFVGRYIAAVGCLALDRENPKNAIKAIKKAGENIRSGYANYGIYPEGGENKTHDPVLLFKSGAFKIAKDAGCPIILSATRGSDHLFRRAFTLRKIHIHVDLLGTISAEEVNAKKTQELSDMSEEIIGAFLTDHPGDAYLDRAGNVKKMY